MKKRRSESVLLAALVALGCGSGGPGALNPSISVLEPQPAQAPLHQELAQLGKLLFFDERVSAGADVSCAQCHVPEKGYSDGVSLASGYPGTKYFRNAKSLLNVAATERHYWDGRLGEASLRKIVEDAITSDYFMAADPLIITERLRLAPDYVRQFRAATGEEPSYGGIVDALTEFLRSLQSQDSPFDRYARGDDSALSSKAKRGLALFVGKAGCSNCHKGHGLTDDMAHNLGVPEAQAIFRDEERHISFRAFLSAHSVPDFVAMRGDPGHMVATGNEHDRGAFLTPGLRDVSRTSPYMHNGTLATLREVVDFYDRGGGPGNAELKSLGLSDHDKDALVEFLESLAGKSIIARVSQEELPRIEHAKRWYITPN